MEAFILKNFIVALIAGNITLGALASATPASTVAIVPPPIISQEAVITPLDLWIDGLIELESRGEEKIKILDVNGYYSYGCLQFQMATFIRFGVKYGLLTQSDNPRQLIYSCDFQKEIAKAMIRENRSNWRHWFTSVKIRKLGPPPVEIELAQLN